MPRTVPFLLWLCCSTLLLVASIIAPAINFSRSVRTPRQTPPQDIGNSLTWFAPPPTGIADEPSHSVSIDSTGYCYETRIANDMPFFAGDSAGYYEQRRLSVGWPFAALANIYRGGNPLGNRLTTWRSSTVLIELFERQLRLEYGIKGNSINGTLLLLPVTPRIAGIVGNFALAGTSVFLLYAAAKGARNAFRRGKGRCVSCNFEVMSLPRCPECGLHARKSLTSAT